MCLCDAIHILCVFYYNDTATTGIYTLSLHDALPISCGACSRRMVRPLEKGMLSAGGSLQPGPSGMGFGRGSSLTSAPTRSEEHTSELQSRPHLVCRLLLEKKKKQPI